MREFLFTAVTGAIAEQRRLDIISNNLANVNTLGYKKEGISFRAYFQDYVRKLSEEINQEEINIGEEIDLPNLLKSTEYVVVSETTTDFSQGSIKVTDNPLDLAIDGGGFFKVRTDKGFLYTRKGNFRLNSKGEIVTAEGYRLMSTMDKPIVISGKNILISDDGEVFVDGSFAGKINIVDFPDRRLLQRLEGQYFRNVNPLGNRELRPSNFRVIQGALETSNVNVVYEMVNMIETLRKFEAGQRVITTFSDTTSRIINQIVM